jgi:hypothetical protein
MPVQVFEGDGVNRLLPVAPRYVYALCVGPPYNHNGGRLEEEADVHNTRGFMEDLAEADVWGRLLAIGMRESDVTRLLHSVRSSLPKVPEPGVPGPVASTRWSARQIELRAAVLPDPYPG